MNGRTAPPNFAIPFGSSNKAPKYAPQIVPQGIPQPFPFQVPNVVLLQQMPLPSVEKKSVSFQGLPPATPGIDDAPVSSPSPVVPVSVVSEETEITPLPQTNLVNLNMEPMPVTVPINVPQTGKISLTIDSTPAPSTAPINLPPVKSTVTNIPLPPIADKQPVKEQLPVEAKMQSKASMDTILREYLYTPIGKITSKDERTGEIIGEYVKCVNPMGIIVFVQMNDGGYVSISKCDLTMTRVGKVDMIPYSVKSCSYEMAAPESVGVAIECSNGVCTIERNTTGEPQETNFMKSDVCKDGNGACYMRPGEGEVKIINPHGDSYITDEGIIFYPIVSMSEIRANPSLVLENTEKSYTKLQKKAKEECDSVFRDFENSFLYMYKACKTLYSDMMEKSADPRDERKSIRIFPENFQITQDHRRSIKELLRISDRWTPEEARVYQTLLKDLKRRSELSMELVKYSYVMLGYSKKVVELSNGLEILDKSVVENFSKLETTL